METVNILRFQRRFDCWVCTACDAENAVNVTHCAVCAQIRTPDATFINRFGQVINPPSPPRGMPQHR